MGGEERGEVEKPRRWGPRGGTPIAARHIRKSEEIQADPGTTTPPPQKGRSEHKLRGTGQLALGS